MKITNLATGNLARRNQYFGLAKRLMVAAAFYPQLLSVLFGMWYSGRERDCFLLCKAGKVDRSSPTKPL